MAKRDGSWLCRLKLDGKVLEASTDDLTLDQLDVAEQVSGVPWPLMNPGGSVRVAKALFAVLMIRAGMEEDEALRRCGELTAEKLHDAFEWVPPEDPLPATEGTADPPN
jgi:hypothetical protein